MSVFGQVISRINVEITGRETDQDFPPYANVCWKINIIVDVFITEIGCVNTFREPADSIEMLT